MTTVFQDSRVIRLEGWNTAKGATDLIAEITLAEVSNEQLIEVNHHAGKSQTENCKETGFAVRVNRTPFTYYS